MARQPTTKQSATPEPDDTPEAPAALPEDTDAASAPEPAAAAAPAAPAAKAGPESNEPKVSLDEWCARRSKSHPKQAIALTPFNNEEEAAGRVMDTSANYEARFTEMLNRPTK